MEKVEDIVIVIPSFNPNEVLLTYLQRLRRLTDKEILVIDDGSNEKSKALLNQCLEEIPRLRVKRHVKNRGKGRSLKTAFAYLLKEHPGIIGAVTCDSDGQYNPEDLISVLNTFKDNPDAVVLGCRVMNQKTHSGRGRFYSKLIRKLFYFAVRRDFEDAQTGLRAIPAAFMKELIKCPGERFEFEAQMLLRLKERKLIQLQTESEYSKGSRRSYFGPIKITAILFGSGIIRFFKFAAFSILTYLIDLLFFLIFYNSTFEKMQVGRLSLSIVSASIISALFSYCCNRFIVFKNRKSKPAKGSFIKFIALFLLVTGSSYLLMKIATVTIPYAQDNMALTKSITDFILFFFSYTVQRFFVFKKAN